MRERRSVLEIVGHDDRRQTQPVEQLTQLGADTTARVRVERGQWLVEQEHRRVARERPGERDTLSLATGELLDARLGEMTDAESVEQLLDPRRAVGPETHVAEHVQMREQRVLLEQVADPPSLRGQVDAALGVEQDRIAEADAPRLWSQQPGHDAQDRRLPGARRPDEGDRLALLDGQIGRCDEAAKGVSESDPERHRVITLTVRRTTALITIRRALIASATSKSTSNCS